LQIRNGKAGFYEGNRLYFEFDNISSNIELRPGWITITLNGKSNFCEKLSVNGKIFPYTSTGEGRIDLTNLNPKIVFDYFFPNSDLKINDSQINLKAHFDNKGFLKFNSNFEGEIPLISFQRKADELVINGRSFSGNFLADKNGTKITINKLDLDNPELSLSGNFSTNKSLSLAEFDLEGENIDINITRNAALFLAGNSGTTKAIFDIIKDGKVPFISIKSEAPSVSELANIENISIRGDILDGKIHVPKPLLELEGVKGNVTVSGGILEGNNLEGRLENSTAKNGILKLGLSEKKEIFYLDTAIHADLSQLPPVLSQVMENKTLLYELSLIKECQGQADGNLIINDDSGGSIKVKVDVSRFNLQAVYGRFSTPVTIIGEKFFLDDSLIFFKLTNGTWGKSSISNLSAGFRHNKDNSFNISSKKSRVFAKDINPFILSFRSARTALKNISFPGGTVNLNNFEINGPLFAPQEWDFNTSGKIENLIIDYDDLFRKPVTITSLIFKTTEKKSPKRLGGKRVVVEECRIASGRSNIAFNGNAVLSKEKLQLDLNGTSDFLEWSSIKEFAENKLFQTGKAKKSSADSFLSGIIKAKVKYLKYEDLTLSPVNADITIGAGNISLAIAECRVASGRSNMAFNGNAVLSKEKLKLDLNATSDFLEWSSIKEFAENKLFQTDTAKKSSGDSFLTGIIKAKVKYLKYGDLTLSPVHTDITLGAGNISFALVDAALCGVSLTGIIETSRNKVELRIFPFARDEKFDSSINCFVNKRQVATGHFSLDGEIFTKGKGDEITGLLNGTLDFKAKDGRIYQLGFLSKIFALLNLTEIFRGKIPDIVGEGFAYNSITASGKLENGNFVITGFVIDGASMAIVCTGNIDLNKERVDLVALVSPFKTFDLILKYIPVVTQILDGNIISIPFRVTGKLNDPEVIPLSPTAVGSGLLNMLQRTIMLPIRIMQPVNTGESKIAEDKAPTGR
ncbi:MAG: AsmA-like C-terminal region-containing protein, partial [Proteobacteria bacterium]|nr:AsmA-like C-terminal region-containing protein [Pseudomonadota bacterium]